MTLYEINAEILSCIDDETGEVIDENKLNALLMERNAKIEGVGLWVKNLESTAKAIKAEEDVLKKRRETAERKTKALRTWLESVLNGQRFETAKISLTFRKSTTTEVDTDKLSKEWCVEKITYTPDKTAIKKALLAGQKIEGACLAEHQNIQIR